MPVLRGEIAAALTSVSALSVARMISRRVISACEVLGAHLQRIEEVNPSAILLGKTNCPEWGSGLETENDLYGRTNNPHDLARTPGGSSGGEAAIVAAGGSPCGLGSDSGGSARIPAHADRGLRAKRR